MLVTCYNSWQDFQRFQQEPEPSSLLWLNLLGGDQNVSRRLVGARGPGGPGLTSARAWSQNQVLVLHVELIRSPADVVPTFSGEPELSELI